MRHAAMLAAAFVAAAPGTVAAQSIASRVDAVRDGVVHFSFAPRPGVCGDGRGSTWFQGPDDASTFNRGYPCVRGPVRVSISRSGGETFAVRSCVACAPRSSSGPDVELGAVNGADAARYLVGLARALGSRAASDAIGTATFADSVNLTPELITLARDANVTLATRRTAMFWLGQSHDPQALKFLRDVLAP